MSNEKLRIGIIGIGMFAVYNHVPQLRETGRVEVVACARRNPERLAMAQQALQIEHGYTDWRRMLEAEPLDAVVVSTPHHAHVEPTLAALERGLHVLVDKPMALSSAEAWTMVEAAEKANRVLMVSGSRIEGKWQMVKQQIQAGLIGRVQQINWAVSTYRRWFWESEGIPADTFALFDTIGLPRAFYGEWQDWHRDPAQMGGGAFVDLGIYQLDLLLWLAGAPGNDPQCFDPVWTAWNDAYLAGEEPNVTRLGVAYMLAGGSDPSNTDPLAMAPLPGEEWVTSPPHLMILVPGGLDPANFTTDHTSGQPYIMWEGTPYEHLMVPVADMEHQH